MLRYVTLCLLSYSGLLLGILLARIAPEEQKPGRDYFLSFHNIMLIASLFFLGHYIVFNLRLFNYIWYGLVLVLLIIFSAAYLIKLRSKDIFMRMGLAYIVLALVFFLSIANPNLQVIESVAIFLALVPSGTLLIDFKKKNFKNVFLNTCLFPAIAIGLYFLHYHFSFLMFR